MDLDRQSLRPDHVQDVACRTGEDGREVLAGLRALWNGGAGRDWCARGALPGHWPTYRGIWEHFQAVRSGPALMRLAPAAATSGRQRRMRPLEAPGPATTPALGLTLEFQGQYNGSMAEQVLFEPLRLDARADRDRE